MTLAAHHYAMLHTDSAIAEAVIAQRGYQSLEHPGEVEALGFASYQAKTAPVLAIPLWNVYGQQSSWQIRPDSPRLSKGKLIKYDTMAESRLQLDVHPSVQPFLGDPRVPLWVTEGVKKGDALASTGACAIALMGGVWGFKGTNEYGAKSVILTDWQSVALNGRTVYVVFDSDSHTKKQVAQALKALCEYLRSRDALPTPIEWPEAYRGEKKWGVDDFLADNKTLDDLLAMLPPSDPVPSAAPPAQNGTAPPQRSGQGPSQDPNEMLTDHYNARALVTASGTVLRYCKPWKCWLLWTGTHWERDATGEVLRFALQAVKGLATRIPSLDKDDANKLLKHIASSLSTVRLKAMLEQAQVGQGIPVLPEDLDRDPWLLNCQNGTLHLKTGTLLGHDRKHLLTKCLPVAYNKDKRCPTWDAFLWHIMGGTPPDQDESDMTEADLERRQAADDRARRLIAFLQRAIGYSLTGLIHEQCLFILHGTGANGKSTFLNVLMALFDAYAQSTPSASLLAKSERHDHIPNDIARLRGARLVTAVEVGEGKRLDEELIKRLTGGEKLSARFLHAEWFDFLPEFKVFIACNHLPVIKGTDHAIWRRPLPVPFRVTIPDDKQDKELPQTLMEELPGILAWAVEGCKTWVANGKKGLAPPPEVIQALKEYREESDDFEGFLTDECHRVEAASATAAKLYDAYESWCKANDKDVLGKQKFGRMLKDKGCVPDKTTGGARLWRGIGLQAKEDTSKKSGVA